MCVGDELGYCRARRSDPQHGSCALLQHAEVFCGAARRPAVRRPGASEYLPIMCMQCMLSAMGSMAAANGTRAWLGRRAFAWLTPIRLRRVTVGLFTAALLASALLMSGSAARPAAGHTSKSVSHLTR